MTVSLKLYLSSVMIALNDPLPLWCCNSALSLSLQVTKGMFGARKKFVEFVEVVDNDFTDESMYYSQPSMFPHRSDKDVSFLFCVCQPFQKGGIFLLSYMSLNVSL